MHLYAYVCIVRHTYMQWRRNSLITSRHLGGDVEKYGILSIVSKLQIYMFVWKKTAEEFLRELMPIFESLRQRESLPCSYPLAMGPSRQTNTFWVNCQNKKWRKNCDRAFFFYLFYYFLTFPAAAASCICILYMLYIGIYIYFISWLYSVE